MPVPGLVSELPVLAKVRVGQKVGGRPTSTDHFVCDDPEFVKLAGEKPTVLRVTFPYAGWNEVFPSGLERWVKGKSSQILTCYTKGDGTAHRLTKGAKAPDGTWKIDPTPGCERRDMPCAAQACVYFGKGQGQGCRPQARLNFQLSDGPRDSVYRFETKGLHSIEKIQGVLEQYADLRGVTFELSVKMVKKGNKQFPVVSVSELVEPHQAVREDGPTDPAKQALWKYLKETQRVGPDTDITASQLAWINRVGAKQALAVLREKDGADA